MTRAAGISVLALAACLVLVDGASAQFMRLERRGYAWLQELRQQLFLRSHDAELDVRRRIAARLAEVGSDTPFTVVADALAIAAGAEPDDLARFRAGVMALVLPEAVDQDTYHEVHVTMYAPRVVPDVGTCAFEVLLRDAKGETRHRELVTEKTAVEDLLRARPTVAIEVKDLPAGRYHVDVRTLVDDQPPRAQDVVAGADFWIVPGFKTRAEALPLATDTTPETSLRVEQLASRIPESRRDAFSRAMLNGALWQVDRVYNAEPGAPGADPAAELQRAEAIYANLCANRPALHGLSGRMNLAVPVDRVPGEVGEPQVMAAVSVDVPDADHADHAKPLCLFVAGAPTWDAHADRPSTPESTDPGWLRAKLDAAGFDSEHRYHVVVLESPGRFSSAPRAVENALRWIERLLPIDGKRTVWIGEREGAYAVSRAAVEDPESPLGIVLATGGLLTADDLEAHPDLFVLGLPAQGHPSTSALLNLPRQFGGDRHARVLDPDGVAWPLVLAERAAAIEEFCETRFAPR